LTYQTTKHRIQVRIEVAFRNAGVVTGKEVIPALGEFARLATAIIKLFDV
jgi:hypothetical protein